MKDNTKKILLSFSSFTTAITTNILSTTVTNIVINNNNNNKIKNYFIRKMGVHRESTGSPHTKKGKSGNETI